jgi:2-C-methyl-D-erythritol 4-phosphate cytidylyltransferase
VSSSAVACVLVAAGRGERLGDELPKTFVEVGGRPLVWHALRALARSTRVAVVAVVVPAGYEDKAGELVRDAGEGMSAVVVAGGATRQESVALGLAALPVGTDIVLVHDAARCLAPPDLFDAVAADVADQHDAVTPGLAVVDTLKQVDGSGRVIATPDRSALRAVQTPQGFRHDVLARAHAAAAERGDHDAPDDASLVERLGLPVHVVDGRPEAFKITRPHDLVLAEAVLARRGSDNPTGARRRS